MLSSDETKPMIGREARVARTAKGRNLKNALALPKGIILVIDGLGGPMKQVTLRGAVNRGAARDATTDVFGHIDPLVTEIDEVTLECHDAHESGQHDSIATNSGQHFERGGDG